MGDLGEVLKWAITDKAGTLLLALAVGVAFIKGWIVPRWAYDKLDKDHERMAQIAFRSIDFSERAATVAEKKVV